MAGARGGRFAARGPRHFVDVRRRWPACPGQSALQRWSRLALALAALASLATPAQAQVQVLSSRIWPAHDYTRLTLESSAEIKHSVFRVKDPERLVLDLEVAEIAPALAELNGKVTSDDPYLQGLRVARNRPGVVRLVLDLKTEVQPQVFVLPPVGEYGYRLVLDIYPAVPIDPLAALIEQSEKKPPAATEAASAPAAPAPTEAPKVARLATIVIDPGHGGSDSGSRISDNIVEKDVTLALAFRLRSLLTARGFNVVLTREDDKAANSSPPFAPLTLDDRAGIANHERASACIFLHATSSGTGVHLYTSELTPAPGELTAAPWLTLQAPWVTQSQHLASRIADALNRSRIPLVDGYASIRPVDSTACPSLVFELAPRTDDPDSINDESYQQSIAQAAANALILWKDAAQPPPHLAPPEPEPNPAEATTP